MLFVGQLLSAAVALASRLPQHRRRNLKILSQIPPGIVLAV